MRDIELTNLNKLIQRSAFFLLSTFVVFVLICLLPVLLCYCLVYSVYHWISRWLNLDTDDIAFSPGDATWYEESSNNRILIQSLVSLDGRISVDDVRQRFSDSIITQHTQFFKLTHREVIKNGVLVWTKEANFSIEDHIMLYKRTIDNDNDLAEKISEFASEGLPTSKSPWNTVVFHKKDGGSVLLFQFRHTIGDGIALIRLLLEYLVDEPFVLGSNVQPHRVQDKVTLSQRFYSYVEMYLGLPILIAQIIRLPDVNCLHGRALSGSKRVAWTNPIPLNDIKKVKNDNRATLNDVLMTIVCEALARYTDNNSLPPLGDVTVFIPASTRPPHGRLVLENSLALIPASLPASKNLTQHSRLKKIKETFDYAKCSNQATLTALLQVLLIKWLPYSAACFIFNKISAMGTAIVSNVPGPSKKVSILGLLVKDMMFFVPAKSNIGLGVSILSYGDHVRIGAKADGITMDDPITFCKLIEECAKDLS